MRSSIQNCVAIHNKNGKGLLPDKISPKLWSKLSQSTIKMEKGYYYNKMYWLPRVLTVAIHNKNGKGLLRGFYLCVCFHFQVAIHNKNGKGLLLRPEKAIPASSGWSQSTIKMEKGYYRNGTEFGVKASAVAIHNKNGKGLLPKLDHCCNFYTVRSQSTIKMEKGYYGRNYN